MNGGIHAGDKLIRIRDDWFTDEYSNYHLYQKLSGSENSSIKTLS